MDEKHGNMRRAVVVGATSGIGLEVTRLLLERGWTVGIAGRRQERLQEIQRKHVGVLATEQIDVTREDAGERLERLVGKLGGMDLYFHSSGIGYQNVALDAAREVATVETNAVGMVRMVDAAFHYFVEQHDGCGQLAVISSIAGTKGLGAAPAYSASKRFVNHYLECLCQLCHMRGLRGLHICDIRPGFVRTPLLQDGHDYPMQMEATKVARTIVDELERGKKTVLTIDWRYRLLVGLWRLIPRWLWVRLNVKS